MNERPLRAEFGTQDSQFSSSSYSTNALCLDPDPIQVGECGDSATASSSAVPVDLNDRGRLLSHHISQIKDSSISDNLLSGIELVKEIHVLHSASSHNTTQLKLLASQVEDFIHGIKKHYQECRDKDNWPPPSIKDNVLDFLNFLNNLRDIIREIQEGGRISGMIHARSIAKRIQALKESMVSNISYFKMCSSIGIQHSLNQVLKAQKQLALTTSNQPSTSSDSVNGATYLTDTQFAEMAHIVSNFTDTQRLETPRNQGTSLKDQEPNETERSRLAIEKQEACPQVRLDERETERAHDAQRIRKLEEEGGRHFLMEQVAELDLEIEGVIERTRLWGLTEHSSSPPSIEQEKEVGLENGAGTPVRPKETPRVKKKKISDGSISATRLEIRVAGMNSAPTQVHSSSPPTLSPPPYHQHGPTTFPYVLPSAYNLSQQLVYLPMGPGMIYPSYPSFYGANFYGQSHLVPPQTTVNNINSGNFANVTISNVNNDNCGKARPKRRKDADTT